MENMAFPLRAQSRKWRIDTRTASPWGETGVDQRGGKCVCFLSECWILYYVIFTLTL